MITYWWVGLLTMTGELGERGEGETRGGLTESSKLLEFWKDPRFRCLRRGSDLVRLSKRVSSWDAPYGNGLTRLVMWCGVEWFWGRRTVWCESVTLSDRLWEDSCELLSSTKAGKADDSSDVSSTKAGKADDSSDVSSVVENRLAAEVGGRRRESGSKRAKNSIPSLKFHCYIIPLDGQVLCCVCVWYSTYYQAEYNNTTCTHTCTHTCTVCTNELLTTYNI